MHVVVVGLGFGSAFVPIYQAHPGVSKVSVCEPNEDRLAQGVEDFNPHKVFKSLDEALADSTVDAVHLLTPLYLHADQTVQVLEAGKHCACAVTMATTLQDITRILDATKQTGKTYMMMETGVYTKEFLLAQELHRQGKFGDFTFLRGDYFQDLEAPYPAYWRKVPPMHYATHSLAPILAISGQQVAKVSCLGGGKLRKDICNDPANPFPMQTAQFRLKDSPAAVQVSRAWYQTGREYVESFSAYGDKGGFEWQQLEHEDPVVFSFDPKKAQESWMGVISKREHAPFRPDLLPEQLSHFADGGHGGSHAHLVHEFVSSMLEGRKPFVDAVKAAQWCAPGICAHESSLKDGEWIDVPSYDWS